MMRGSASPISTSSAYRESASSCLYALRMRPTRMSSVFAVSLTSINASTLRLLPVPPGASSTMAEVAVEAASGEAVQNEGAEESLLLRSRETVPLLTDDGALVLPTARGRSRGGRRQEEERRPQLSRALEAAAADRCRLHHYCYPFSVRQLN
ncbi:hypothetical protein SAY87_024536 [Trapa incisa]|uniref:Uncharacterized protein n=1 Tax=Trapa incisa TaxID=236973 RepID=A0AAN7JG02_9MYRT|nr:hypothetical protein SAY87_024536 [Trapa incisa]